jgi:protein-S-isoprenylcysteine O-methyltransferase Ste14
VKAFLFQRGFILPVMVTGVIPIGLAVLTHAWLGTSAPFVLLGAAVYAVGVRLLARTTNLFASHRGSLAPWNPPQDMVSSSLYRHVRNPMMLGIFHMLAGEAIALRSLAIGAWLAVFAIGQHIYIVFDEEPLLRKRFGEPYARYCAKVPRWIPRVHAADVD